MAFLAASAYRHRKGRRSLAGETDPAKVREELDRRRNDAAADAKVRASAPESPSPSGGGDSGPAPLFSAGPMEAASTGGGFLLGLGVWIVAVNYLQGGLPQVKRFAAAKFLNRTGG